MAITRDTVLHIARLARLELAPGEAETLEADLTKILGYVEKLSELSTEGVAETTQVATERAPLRPDELVPSLDIEAALGEAPRRAGGGFAVPTFVDE